MDKTNIHFLHIGKTGGSAVRYVLKHCDHSSKFCLVLHPGHRTGLRDVTRGDKVIFFVRDPVSRFVSAFNSRLRMGQPRYFFRWTPAEEKAFSYFGSPNQLALALRDPNKRMRSRAQFAMKNIQHLQGLSYWLGSPEYLSMRIADLFFIGKQERLKDDFDCLKKRLGIAPDVQLPEDTVIAHKTPAGMCTLLEASAVNNLKDWYRRDYDFLAQIDTVIERINGSSAAAARAI